MNDEIEVNSIKYVKKSQKSSEYKIVRGDRSGVFFGEIISRNGREVVMKDARRIWYWDGACSLSQLAQNGTTKPATCKFPCPVEKIEILDAIEILDVTEKAKKSIDGVVVWSQ